MLKQLTLFICSATLLVFTYVASAADHTLLLDGTDGKKHALNEYIGHGKWVVVNVWATACPYCRHELFDLTNFHNAHQDKDAMVLGLALDFPSFDLPDKEYLADFSSSHFIDYPLLMVSGEVASEVIGKPVNMVPLSFFYNPEGKLVYRLNGMVTERELEKVISSQPSSFRTGWADEVPPEYQPKPQ
jgi:peroxiredoxin